MAVDAADLFHAQLPAIEDVIRFVARRRRLPAADAEEFAAHVRLKLIEDDYAILRRFGQRSTLRTYLCTVVQRLFLDYRISQWGKWRPSAEARRAGPIAMRLEWLMTRDGLSFDQAADVLLISERVEATVAELEALRARLPQRVPRRFVGEEVITGLAVDASVTEAALAARDGAAAAARARAALAVALRDLPPRERLILRMRFDDGMSIADIARVLRVDQKPLYRQVDRVLAQLRASLEDQGIRGEDIGDWVGRAEWDAGGMGNAPASPSF